MLFETPRLRLAAQYRIATLALDGPLSRPALLDLDAALRIVQARPGYDVLVLRGLSQGPDDWTDPAELAELGQRVAARLADLDAVTVAFLDGPCHDGALELALACDSRAAAGGPRTRLGFRGLRAGRAPCWGGAVRLPRVVGLKRALDLLLDGRLLSAAQAHAAGLVDRAWGPRLAPIHLAAFALELQGSGDKPRRRPPLIDLLPGRRAALLRAARRRVEREFSADQAAPRALVRAVEAGVRGGVAEGLAAERGAVPTHPLPRVGLNGTTLPHQPTTPPPHHPTTSPPHHLTSSPPHHLTPPITRLGILGGGTIGAAVAVWAALRGQRVAVHDRDPAAARRRLEAHFRDAVDRRLVPAEVVPAKLDGIFCSDTWDGFGDVELVIEAADEDRERKRWLLAEAERRAGPAALLATTTTAFTVRALQEGLARPGRLVGLHFGCPAAALRQVEVAAGPATDPRSVARARAWLAAHGRDAIIGADRPGRVRGRVLLPYLREAVLLAEDGVPPAAIDAALRRWGMAWGPCAALDAVGLDVAMLTLRELAAVYGGRYEPPALLARLVLQGRHGVKSGHGFYRGDRPSPRPIGTLDPDLEARIVERTVGRLVKSAAAVLREGLVGDAAALDALLLGAGWPPFRGLPSRYAAALARRAAPPSARRVRAAA